MAMHNVVRSSVVFLAAFLIAQCGESGTEPANPTPGLLSLSPAHVTAGADDVTVTLSGNDFVRSSHVLFAGAARATEYVDATRLRLTLTAADVAAPGSYSIVVSNPAPGGGASNTLSLTVDSVVSPVPVPTEVRPAEVTAGAANAVDVTVLGSDFAQGAMVRVGDGGSPFAATAVWPDSLHADIPAGDLADGDTLALYVINPSPGGGVGGPVLLSVVNPVPSVSMVSPSQAQAGGSSLFVAVTGTGFVTSSQILVNGSPRETSRIGPTKVRATLPAADVAVADTLVFTVSNPAPGGGLSATSARLQVTAPAPVLDALPAGAATAGAGGFALLVDGGNFLRNTVVRWNGEDRPTSYISPQRLAADIGSSDVAAPGAATITLYTPGGGTSSSMDFTVHTFAAPAIVDQHVLDLPAADVVWSAVTQRLYAAIPVSSPALAGTVVAIDPTTGTVTDTVPVDMDPERLAISDDGSALYVAFADTSEVQRLALPSLATDLRFDLGGGTYTGSYRVKEMAVVPGNPSLLTVSLRKTCCTPPYEGMVLMDDGVALPTGLAPVVGTGTIAFASAGMFYSYDNESTSFGLSTVRVEPDGLYRDSVHFGLFDGFGQDIHYANGWVYSDRGTIVDGEQFVRVASLAEGDSALGAILPAPALGRALFLRNDGELSAYDLDTFRLLGSVTVPGVQNAGTVGDYRMPIVRWGTDGIAFRDGVHTFILRTTLVQP